MNLKALGGEQPVKNEQKEKPKIYLCFIRATFLKKKYRKKLSDILIKFLKEKPNMKKYELPLVETEQTQKEKEDKMIEEEILVKEIQPTIEKNKKTKNEIRNEDSSTNSESNEHLKNKKTNNGKKAKNENISNKNKTESTKAKKEIASK